MHADHGLDDRNSYCVVIVFVMTRGQYTLSYVIIMVKNNYF